MQMKKIHTDRVKECAECGRVLMRDGIDELTHNERSAVASLLERSIERIENFLLKKDLPDPPSDLNGTWATVSALYYSALIKIQRGGIQ